MSKFAFDPPRLERIDAPPSSDSGQDDSAFKSFNIKQGDKHLGELHTEGYGKRIEINNVVVGSGPNTLGPRHVRALAKQLKEHYPGAEEVSGVRISGARYKDVDPDDPKTYHSNNYDRLKSRVKI